MVATSVARFTLASTTPSVFRRKRSIRLLQEAQVIPTTGKLTSSGEVSVATAGSTGGLAGRAGTLVVILPGSIPPGRWRSHPGRRSLRRGQLDPDRARRRRGPCARGARGRAVHSVDELGLPRRTSGGRRPARPRRP